MRNHLRRLLSLCLAAAAIASMSISAFALDTTTVTTDGGSADASVMLSVDENPLTNVFSATIPAVIPAVVDTNGKVTVPTNIEIVNNNVYRSIKATDISVTPATGWTIQDYVSGDFTTKDTKNLGMSFRGDTVSAETKKVTLSDDNWTISADDKLGITFGLKVNPQTSIGSLGNIATIQFTLDWADSSTSETPDPEPDADEYYTINFEVGANGSILDSDKVLKLKKSEVTLGETRITFPSVVPNSGYYLEKWVQVINGVETDITNESISLIDDAATMRAIFKQQAAQTVYLTYHAGEHGQIQRDDNSLVDVDTESFTVSGGSFSVTMPTIVPDEGWEFDKWVNTADGSDTSSGGLKNNGNNNFEVTATYKSAKVYVTFRTDNNEATLVDKNGNTLGDGHIYQTTFTSLSSFEFPYVSLANGRTMDYWVNTNDGSQASGSDGQIKWVNETARTLDFTTNTKEGPKIYVYPSVGEGGHFASGASSDRFYMPYETTVQFPTVEADESYTFLGWYYSDGTAIRTNSTGTYILDDSKGTLHDDVNELWVPVVAKFTKTSTQSDMRDVPAVASVIPLTDAEAVVNSASASLPNTESSVQAFGGAGNASVPALTAVLD